jgi:hypothetical protein
MMLEGSTPTTRFSTALVALCWLKRVLSTAAIENDCQFMMELGLLVTLSVLPELFMETVPFDT